MEEIWKCSLHASKSLWFKKVTYRKITTSQPFQKVSPFSWTCCGSFFFPPLSSYESPAPLHSAALSRFPPLHLSVCLSVCLFPALFVSLSRLCSPFFSERWHWETAVTWDDSRSWQGLRKPRQWGGRGPLSETGGADLPHYPSLFLLLSRPVCTSTSIFSPILPPPTEAKTATLRKSLPMWMKCAWAVYTI